MPYEGQCDVCTRDGCAYDLHGRWLCEECVFESTVGDEYDDLEYALDYADPD